MSFRRPKKPIRPRVVALHVSEDEEDHHPQGVEQENIKTQNNKPTIKIEKMEVDDEDIDDDSPVVIKEEKTKNGHSSKSKSKDTKDKGKGSLLSFDDDLDGDDGEVFQVKKSSVSRRLMKQKHKDKKDTNKNDKKPPPEKSSDNYPRAQIKQEDKPRKPIKVESSDDGDHPFIRVLNGRAAEALHAEEEDLNSSEEEEEDLSTPKFRFRTPNTKISQNQIQDALRRTLDAGQIPDANLIHEARKRKQMAREKGGQGQPQEFIPIPDNTQKFKNSKGRLIREEDQEHDSEEEDRLDFSSATNAARIDRERRIEDFNAAQDEVPSDDEDNEELDEWENQQIRKGVSQVKMQSVAKDFMMYGGGGGDLHHHQGGGGGFTFFNPHQNQKEEDEATKLMKSRKGRTQAFLEQTQKIASIEEIVNGSKRITPEMVMKQMTERLERLRLSRDRNNGELSRVEADLNLADRELQESQVLKGGLNERFILYQNLGGYVTDLTDCLQQKVPEIISLEDRMIDLMKSRRDKFIERRRQDVRDQTEEVAATINIMGGAPVNKPPPSMSEERTRRMAEREGRRTRRRRIREKERDSTDDKHKDGLSSDDEEPDIEWKGYCASRENILGQASTIFDDVLEDFGSVDGILQRFEEWKDHDFDAYKESYAFLCLPKCLAPIVRVHLLGWDPLKENCDFYKTPWMRSLLSFCYKRNEKIEDLMTDPDSRLIPSLVEKVVLPWVGRIIETSWDPMSTSQTRSIVNLLHRLIEDYSISPNGKGIHSLLQLVISRLREAVDNDVYVPIYPGGAIANSFTPASVFSSRQFWTSVKLLDNMSKWQGLLGDRPLQALALDSLLTRYTLLGLRITKDLPESVERAKGIVNVLPRAWFSSFSRNNNEVLNGLVQFNRCLVSVVQSTDCTIVANRLAIPEAANVLKTLGFQEDGQKILKKYS